MYLQARVPAFLGLPVSSLVTAASGGQLRQVLLKIMQRVLQKSIVVCKEDFMTKGAAQAKSLYLEVDSERSAMHSEGPPGQFHMQPPALRYLCVRRFPQAHA